MTLLEYLLYLKDNKGLLLDEETRLDELNSDDKERLIKQGLIFIYDYPGDSITVELSQAGEDFINSLN